MSESRCGKLPLGIDSEAGFSGGRITPAEALELRKFSPYLIPVLPPGRTLRKGKLSEGKEPNWNVIEQQRGTNSPNVYREKPPSADNVLGWIEDDPDTNIGLLTGKAPGRVALDVDGPLPGCWDLLDLPATPTTSSGRTEGGRHMHFATSSSVTTTGEIVLSCNGTKLQLIGEGGYMVAPGSIHKTGTRYAWIDGLSPDEVPLAHVPDWLPEVFGGARGQTPSHNCIPTNKKLTSTSIPYISDKLNIHLVEVRRDVLDPVLVEGLNQSLDVGALALNGMGCEARASGAFPCIRHGDDKTDSAALHRADDGRVLYKCFHHDSKAVTIGQVYAEQLNGALYDAPRDDSTRWSDRRMDPGEARVWTVRAYHERLGYRLPDLEVEPRELEFKAGKPRADARANIVKAYKGYILLRRVRRAYKPGSCSAPYSYRFAARWCGIEKDAAGAAIMWLRNHGYLTVSGKTSSGLSLYSLVGVGKKARPVPGADIDDAEVPGMASAVAAVGVAIDGLAESFGVLAGEMGLDEAGQTAEELAAAGGVQ